MGAKQKRFKTEEKDWIDYRKDLAELQKEIRRQLREFNETMEAIREEAETLQTSCWVENEEDSGFDVLASLEFKYLSENIRQLLELICSLEGRLTRPPWELPKEISDWCKQSDYVLPKVESSIHNVTESKLTK